MMTELFLNINYSSRRSLKRDLYAFEGVLNRRGVGRSDKFKLSTTYKKHHQQQQQHNNNNNYNRIQNLVNSII